MKKLNNCYLAVIPARGGSKRIPRKNIILLGEKPLIAYTINAALQSRKITKVVVSTDDEEIARVAELNKVEVPFMRPPRISQDKSPILDVLKHALQKTEVRGKKFDAVILLQPTSPLRTVSHIDECIDLFEKSGADTVTSVCECREHPFYVWKEKKIEIKPFFSWKHMSLERHKLPKAYIENGAVYVIKREILQKGTIYGKKVVPYIMDRTQSVDIDEPIDLLWVRFLKQQENKE